MSGWACGRVHGWVYTQARTHSYTHAPTHIIRAQCGCELHYITLVPLMCVIDADTRTTRTNLNDLNTIVHAHERHRITVSVPSRVFSPGL